MTKLFWGTIHFLAKHKRTRNLAVLYCTYRFGVNFRGFYNGVPVVRTNYLS